ncbi:hypothetical protein FJ651_00590 [Paucihalobacter ruber]|uniref:Uncharacterized protein n=1 Tax=Paucihalobacter ruber TaxID=2567861 RepID=A0A506PQF6_9FLAO|nr:hypothetical protein [Paucihalobacter ruber]TPV35452.1 hypothetical protein FJ651_00590 [Paucihalobacter ruber]
MKRSLYYTTSFLMLTLFLLNCKSNDKKVDDTNNITESTTAQLNEEQQKLNAEYKAFKTYALAEIEENDENIEKLQAKIDEPGKTLDEARKRRITDLKEQNTELRNRLNNYNLNTSDWQSFKTNFNKDLKSVGDSFRDLFSAN